MRNKKHKGVEYLKSRYGMMFITPWIIGIVLFFALPLIQSVIYSFSEVILNAEGMKISLKGIVHYKYIITEHPEYTNMLTESLVSILYQLPLIVILSLILALMLNRDFRGRVFFRGLYFLPVIIATGIAMELIFRTTTADVSASGPEAIQGSLFSVTDIMKFLSLPSGIADYVSVVVNNIFNLVWNCGIQIILFISGLQSIPSTLYEASHVEGATKWEQFWFITFPMLGRINLLVVVFTMVELFTDTRNELMKYISTMMQGGTYDETSAMLWFYFLIVGGVIGIVMFLYNSKILRKWE